VMPRTLRLALAFAQEGSSLPSAAGACFARKAVVRGRPPTARRGTRALTEAGRNRPTGAVLLVANWREGE
jgi:hypothetical protein